ncbi:MAG: hypothetical protein ABJM26_17720 [Anderseniella sp.]
MTSILVALFLVCAVFVQTAPAVSQSAYPVAVSSATNAEGFVAGGWLLEHRINNDLNADGLNDLVLIVRQTREQVGTDGKSFDVMRRLILIAFMDKQSGRYRLVQQENAFIPVRETVNVEDYLSGYNPLKPIPGGFSVDLELFMSAGGWEMELRTFQFEYRNGQFVLVNFDSQRTHRSSGETTGIKVDYLTGLVVKNSGNAQDDEIREASENLAVPRLFNLEDIGPGFDFIPVPAKD